MDAALLRLERHFDRAAEAGVPRSVWWRDDDAIRLGPKLARLLELARAHGAPIALAVIPEGAEPALLERCSREAITIMQHGIAHTNHQATGKPAELGDARSVETSLADLAKARARLASPAFLPVLVPPWNRLRPDLAPALSEAGFWGLSLFGGPVSDHPLRRLDTHIDPIDWRGARDLLPADRLDAMTAAALATDGPIGLLTHHAVHKAAVHDFAERFAALVARHPGAAWADPQKLFAAVR